MSLGIQLYLSVHLNVCSCIHEQKMNEGYFASEPFYTNCFTHTNPGMIMIVQGG